MNERQACLTTLVYTQGGVDKREVSEADEVYAINEAPFMLFNHGREEDEANERAIVVLLAADTKEEARLQPLYKKRVEERWRPPPPTSTLLWSEARVRSRIMNAVSHFDARVVLGDLVRGVCTVDGANALLDLQVTTVEKDVSWLLTLSLNEASRLSAQDETLLVSRFSGRWRVYFDRVDDPHLFHINVHKK